MNAILNIGLHVEGKLTLTIFEVIPVVNVTGVTVLRWRILQSTTEPTLVVETNLPLQPHQGLAVALLLRQDCIAQWHNGVGELFGPKAEKWGPFNREFFLDFEEVQS